MHSVSQDTLNFFQIVSNELHILNESLGYCPAIQGHRKWHESIRYLRLPIWELHNWHISYCFRDKRRHWVENRRYWLLNFRVFEHPKHPLNSAVLHDALMCRPSSSTTTTASLTTLWRLFMLVYVVKEQQSITNTEKDNWFINYTFLLKINRRSYPYHDQMTKVIFDVTIRHSSTVSRVRTQGSEPRGSCPQWLHLVHN